MGYEVEIKFRVADPARLGRALADRGLVRESTAVEQDSYYNHPSRDFAATHEALRLRRIESENRITYKGPRRAGPTKTREEIEVTFADGPKAFDDFRRLLENLGFRVVATIKKTRQTYHWSNQGVPLEILLDHAEGLGHFAEIEALADTETGLDSAQAAVLAAARELGLSEVEPRSYLRMNLESGQVSAPGSGSNA
jgi:adenylate cyclase class 2